MDPIVLQSQDRQSLRSHLPAGNRREVLNALRNEQGIKLVDLLSCKRSSLELGEKDSTTHNQVSEKKAAPRAAAP